MNIFLLLFIFFPLFEIAGFVVIGGEIGLGSTLLWLMASAALGIWVLRGQGGIWARVQTADDDLFVVEGMFDALCLLAAGLLLIFPGFISDFIALPLLVPPLRRLIFRHIQKRPDGFIRRHARFTNTTRHGGSNTQTTIIEAEYSEIDPVPTQVDNSAPTLPPQNQ
ncbi:MAG: FxsA family protein [Alphaproteobacteria bacterium]|nr:FxsA family protein [Alphaproteobacteria bacterium]